MIDFLLIATRLTNKGITEIYPKFKIRNPSEHLMIRGGDFYAVWLEDRGLWSTSEQDAIDLIDSELDRYVEENRQRLESGYRVLHMWDAESGMIDVWHKYCQRQMRDSFHMLDERLIFANTPLTRKDYASHRLSYPLEEGKTEAWERLLSVLYAPEERHKIEWAIGSIVSGESRNLQKFMVLYGAAGTGKSTIIQIVEKMFEGYTSVFDARALGSASNSFALEAFKTNPLVAILHDGDLSKIEDNTRLNSLVSHELMTVNEKFKSTYANRFKCFLFMGTNKPVKITDAKSGLIRRLIDVTPTGNKLSPGEYKQVMKKIEFELGAIAYRCREIFLSDPDHYNDYIPINMLGASNDFYNFVMDSWFTFDGNDSTTLKAAWEMYKTYCDEAKVPFQYSQRVFKEELKNYFRSYDERKLMPDGTRVRNLYSGFRSDKFGNEQETEEHKEGKQIDLREQPSLLDDILKDCPAQYATEEGTPVSKWANVKTTLLDIDTRKTHYVKVPSNHIVIDFDIRNASGEKDISLNLKEASKWPTTYAEISKGGNGIHLHYIYDGDVTQLSSVYDDKIEVKVFSGNASLRRKLSKCNDIPVATLSHGLPLKEVKKVVNYDTIKSEKLLRNSILRALAKEVHPDTSSNINFIAHILEEAYDSDLKYDVSDMENAIIGFAAKSTNQAERCLKAVATMKFHSKEEQPSQDLEAPIAFYDVEVFPNLFLVNWKLHGQGKPVIRMINPSPMDIEQLFQYRLIGFNCRKYDNHILYARYLNRTNEQLYDISQRIISGDKTAMFGDAYNLSYTDVYDFAAKKQSLKKWEIELGLHHQELGLPWDQPVPEHLWPKVAEYCDNDVISTEAVFNELQGDFTARKILADLAGMSVNDTTNSLTTRIIFGKERNPQLVYTHLEETFPGYEYRKWREGDSFEDDGRFHNVYRDTDMGFGGYIRSWPGMYGNVALLDVASLHPNSIRAMNCFGAYTKNFTDILDARVAIKHGDFVTARKMLNGKLAPYLNDETMADALAQALKIAINSVYGLTSASFPNPFRDPRNVNNIVALRGALFMRTLQDEVEKRGFKIVAIKTDSIKIADATKEIIDFCMDFAKQYGYTFEHEATYEKMAQVNDADYIAKYKNPEACEKLYGYVPKDNRKHPEQWTSTGAQFSVPYVFKRLFSREPIEFKDLCETKEVKTALFLDMNEDLEDSTRMEKQLAKMQKSGDASDADICELKQRIKACHKYVFVGKVGQFCPMKPGTGGGLLMRRAGDKFAAATGTKGYRWMESEMVQRLEKEADIDRSYYDKLVDEAKDKISQYGDFEWFASEDRYDIPPEG